MPSTNEGGTEESHGEQETNGDTGIMSQIYDKLFKGKAAAWTAAFTAVLAVFSYLLLKISDSANQLSIATQAASVSSIGPAVVKVPNLDGKTLKGYNIVFTWVNSGSTPTRTAELSSNVYMGTSSPGPGLDFNQLPQSRIVTAVIAPHSGLQTEPHLITAQDLEDVQEGRKHMFFWGWAVYRDRFSTTPRLSEYCFDVEGAVWTKKKHEDFTGEVTLLNTPCPVHFCFNEECEDYNSRTK
jgi:hypothetical protein